ncbi:Hypothetical protein FKW44_012023 [Caligus rogercresseyi]|uniref:Uncharacterized protein n=1 Tax=Caligus rogercresseyi TaxID=217165 RepID=A0A7T8KAM7_CALRO|nr:Hypothetical protein FKW44_012023 [Caligus rogercresseyi]
MNFAQLFLMKLRSRLTQVSSMTDFRCSFEVKLITERERALQPPKDSIVIHK